MVINNLIDFSYNEFLTMIEKQYYVYIMTNKNNNVLYTGVTNNLLRRVIEHKSGRGNSFTARYKVRKVVYYEAGNDINAAILREKQIKGGSRKKKVELIQGMNPNWEDPFKKLIDS